MLCFKQVFFELAKESRHLRPLSLRVLELIFRFLTVSRMSRSLRLLRNGYRLSETLPKNSKVKKHLQQWLQHLLIQQRLTDLPLLVSSDIIESLLGNFKHIIERSPQADMSRTTLLIPALYGNLDKATVTHALGRARHNDLEIWEKENIPYTVLYARNVKLFCLRQPEKDMQETWRFIWDFLGDRIKSCGAIPPLPDIVRGRAAVASAVP